MNGNAYSFIQTTPTWDITKVIIHPFTCFYKVNHEGKGSWGVRYYRPYFSRGHVYVGVVPISSPLQSYPPQHYISSTLVQPGKIWYTRWVSNWYALDASTLTTLLSTLTFHQQWLPQIQELQGKGNTVLISFQNAYENFQYLRFVSL